MNDKKYVVYFFFFKIIWKTPIKIKITPLAILTVICSWKNIIPKKIAVNGSKAPSIAVVVEPINFIEIVIVSSDIIVGNNALMVLIKFVVESLLIYCKCKLLNLLS